MKSYFKLFFIICFIGCKPYDNVVYQPSFTYPLTDDVIKPNKSIEKMVSPYKDGLAKEMNKVIGTSPKFLVKQRPSSALGSFMADACMYIAKDEGYNPDFCLLNYGGIRSTLDSGDITVGDIYSIMPFENELTMLRLSSNQLDSLKSIVISKGGEPFSEELMTLKQKDTYWVLTNNYMANGGDNYAIFKRITERKETHIKLRDALIRYVETKNEIPLDSRNREIEKK